MNQYQFSDKSKQRIEEFLRRREARLDDHLGRLSRLYQVARDANVYTRRQQAQVTQSLAVGKPDDSEVIEGTCFVVCSSSDGIYQQELKRIEALRQTVFQPDACIIGAWLLAVIFGYFGRYWLALDLLGLAGVLYYLKFFRAANATCPSCRKPFGSSQWLPTRLGSNVCQNCGLSIEAMR
jgi:hypothetical protein